MTLVDAFVPGKSGAIAYQPSGGSTVYLPQTQADFQISNGTEVIDLINNAAYPSNAVQGTTIGSFVLDMPYTLAATPAAFWTTAFLSGAGDYNTVNFHQLTQYLDGAGSTPVNYNNVKFSRWQGGVTFSPNGAAQIAMNRVSGLIQDPVHGSALAAPSAGALSSGNDILGFANTSYTGVSSVTALNWMVSTGLVIAPGYNAGSNPLYPYLSNGFVQTTLVGDLVVTQSAYAGTVASGVTTIVMNLGGSGTGSSFTFKVVRVGDGRPQNPGLNIWQYRFKLIGNGTTPPIAVANL